MTINRNNYESFFLLAVDNELSALERNMLEDFLKYNTDLQKEYSLLQKSILPEEEIVFKPKASLLKPELISAAIEEKILLFIDNELSEEEAGKFKLVTKNDNRINAEIQLLQQTKLLPDTKIAFANKQLLYKKEAGKVIPFAWLKFAAAAVLIGFGIWGAIQYLPVANKGLINDVAVETSSNKIPKQLAEINPAAAPLPQETISTKSSTLTEEGTIAKIIVKPSLKNIKIQVNLKEDKIFATEQKLNKPTNNLPKPYYEKTNNKPVDINPLNTIDNNSSNTAFNNKPAKITNAAIENKIYTTSFTDDKDTNKEDQFTFSDEEEGPKKSRLSGFLRKAKRVLERSTKIKPGNENLKVANFEFATQ